MGNFCPEGYGRLSGGGCDIYDSLSKRIWTRQIRGCGRWSMAARHFRPPFSSTLMLVSLAHMTIILVVGAASLYLMHNFAR
jgi:hypothetical protein